MFEFNLIINESHEMTFFGHNNIDQTGFFFPEKIIHQLGKWVKKGYIFPFFHLLYVERRNEIVAQLLIIKVTNII